MTPAALTREPDDLFECIADWREAGKAVALATVVRTWGSSPRPVGSHLAVEEGGAFVGSVSGGCIEGAVVAQALEAIADGKPRLLEFGVSRRARLGGGSRLRRSRAGLCGADRMRPDTSIGCWTPNGQAPGGPGDPPRRRRPDRSSRAMPAMGIWP